MKIERLSENSIRCTLNRADLDSRELKISELAYGTEKAKSLFILIDKINLVKYKRYFTRFILIRVNIQKIIKITIM